MKYIAINIIILAFLCQSCGEEKLHPDDFFGEWKSKDNASIKFNIDGTCTFENIDWRLIYGFSPVEEFHSSTGEWVFNVSNLSFEKNKIKIVANGILSKNDSVGTSHFSFYLNIKKVNLFNDKMSIYSYIGDPDLWDLYEFLKVE